MKIPGHAPGLPISEVQSVIRTSGSADLAFAIVLMASYFATFSSLKTATLLDIVLLIALGIAYVSIGIYGYAYCARSNSFWLHLAYFAIQIPLGGWIVYLSKSSGLNALILLPLAGHSVMLLKQRWVILCNLLILAAYITATVSFSDGLVNAFNTLPTFLAGQLFVMVFTQMALSEEKARREVERLLGELENANQRLREYAVQAEELATARERNRLAREIHDGLGHYLTTVHMQLQAARAVIQSNPRRAQEVLTNAQNLTQEALADVRASVASLRTVDDALPLTERIEKVVAATAQAGPHPAYHVIGTARPLSPQAELTLFRAAQEGLNNACKHAHASRIEVTLDYSGDQTVWLVVEDDGQGAEQTDSGFGLLGIKERVNLLEGDFQVKTSLGKGFRLEVGVPA